MTGFQKSDPKTPWFHSSRRAPAETSRSSASTRTLANDRTALSEYARHPFLQENTKQRKCSESSDRGSACGGLRFAHEGPVVGEARSALARPVWRDPEGCQPTCGAAKLMVALARQLFRPPERSRSSNLRSLSHGGFFLVRYRWAAGEATRSSRLTWRMVVSDVGLYGRPRTRLGRSGCIFQAHS
jgi:hypothetical protein